MFNLALISALLVCSSNATRRRSAFKVHRKTFKDKPSGNRCKAKDSEAWEKAGCLVEHPSGTTVQDLGTVKYTEFKDSQVECHDDGGEFEVTSVTQELKNALQVDSLPENYNVPMNDACNSPIPLTCGDSIVGNTTGATFDGAPFCDTSNTAPGVWYQLTVSEGTLWEATTCSDDTNYDTKLTAYTDGCDALNCVQGDDDDFSCPSSSFHSTVFGSATPVLLLVHGFGSNTGNFRLTISCVDPPPINDDVCFPVVVGAPGSSSVNNRIATAQPGEVVPPPGSGPGATCNTQNGWCSFDPQPIVQNSLWYTFSAPDSGCVTIDATGFDSQLAVYSVGDCGDFSTFTMLAANDDGGSFLEARIATLTCLDPGAEYYIQLDGFGGASTAAGLISITSSGCPAAKLSVNAGECQTAFIGVGVNQSNYLEAEIAGGSEPYDIVWTGPNIAYTDCQRAAVSAQSVGCSIYTVTVTDALGCTVTDEVEIFGIDINECTPPGRKKPRVAVCHCTKCKQVDLCVDLAALPAHMAQGDSLGPCHLTCTETGMPFDEIPDSDRNLS